MSWSINPAYAKRFADQAFHRLPKIYRISYDGIPRYFVSFRSIPSRRRRPFLILPTTSPSKNTSPVCMHARTDSDACGIHPLQNDLHPYNPPIGENFFRVCSPFILPSSTHPNVTQYHCTVLDTCISWVALHPSRSQPPQLCSERGTISR